MKNSYISCQQKTTSKKYQSSLYPIPLACLTVCTSKLLGEANKKIIVAWLQGGKYDPYSSFFVIFFVAVANKIKKFALFV